jgi:hypothetical protein
LNQKKKLENLIKSPSLMLFDLGFQRHESPASKGTIMRMLQNNPKIDLLIWVCLIIIVGQLIGVGACSVFLSNLVM